MGKLAARTANLMVKTAKLFSIQAINGFSADTGYSLLQVIILSP